MELDDVLNLDLDNLADMKYKALKKHTIKVLKKITELIENDKLEEAEKMLANSPAGDCMGCDNNYINFEYRIKIPNYDDGMDIGRVLEDLENLKQNGNTCQNE